MTKNLVQYHIRYKRSTGHTWCFAYTPENAGKLLRRLVEYAKDPECDFDLLDLCDVGYRLCQDIECILDSLQ